MKQLDVGFAAHLAGDVTTLATCWRLTLTDGTLMGFTDHDADLTIAGLAYAAATGLTASEAVAAADLSVGGGEIAGALSAAAVTEADIVAGRYDGAAIDVYLVNWASPTQYAHLRSGLLGEVVRRDGAFTAEVRSLTQRLDQPKGRLYQHRCDADLGDARCGIDLPAPAFRGAGMVIASPDRSRISVSGLSSFAAGWFARGRLRFTTGANAGRRVEVKVHSVDAGGVSLELWQPMARSIAVGDQVEVTAGCDKRIETCSDRFSNVVNFRGFPHIPGSDFMLAHPAASSHPNDGKALLS